jgi:hypothetical protein
MILALLGAVASAQAEAPPLLAELAREWLDLERGRLTFAVEPASDPGFGGELARPRWPLHRDRLLDASGELLWERYLHEGAGGAPGRTLALAREGREAEWIVVPPEGRIPERLGTPQRLLEALLVAATPTGVRVGRTPWEHRLELEPLTALRLAREALPARAATLSTATGHVRIVHPDPALWRFVATLDVLPGGPVEVTLVLDGLDGIIPYRLPPEVARRLEVLMPRPFPFKVVPRLLDHYASARDRVEVTLPLWWSDRDGGLGGEGRLLDFEVLEVSWRDSRGEPVTGRLEGPRPTGLKGGELRWTFVDPAAAGHTELHLELQVRINLYPVRVRAGYVRGATGEETVWTPAGPPTTEVGDLPAGVKPVRRR